MKSIASSFGNKKILVIDDDLGILEVIRLILDEYGYRVKTARPNEGILKFIIKEAPDLIILDLWMVGLNGKELSRKIKNIKSTSKIPIIVISALTEIASVAREIGANAYLTKPFDIDDLVNLVKKYIK